MIKNQRVERRTYIVTTDYLAYKWGSCGTPVLKFLGVFGIEKLIYVQNVKVEVQWGS
jgi:hypothetical protein